MAVDLKPTDHFFTIHPSGEKQPLGEDRMYWLIDRLFKRAGITGFTGHDLRRTFATMVMMASKDELLAMRLFWDMIPGVDDRYIKYPMDQLVAAFKMYSTPSWTRRAKKTVSEPVTGLVETREDKP
jgi:integrase